MFVQINELLMFVEDRSSSDFETILFIHGFPFDHSMWREQLYLAGTEFRCIAPDLRGHGGTTETGEPRSTDQVTVDLFADDLIALLDYIHPRDKKITICGQSLGGYIALAMWRKIPGRIRSLILADTKAPADTPEGRARRATQAEAIKAGGPKAVSGALLDMLMTSRNRNSVIGMDVRRMIESTSPMGMVNTLHALASRPDSTDILATITVPTLVVVGDQDKITPVGDSQYMHERLRHSAPVAVIPEAGHISPLENPHEFNRVVLDFLKAKP